MGRRGFSFGRVLLILFLAFLGFSVVYGSYFLYNKSKEKPVVFETKSPETRTIIKKTVATGSVVPRKEIEIKPQVSGIVHKVYVEPGQIVKRGDKIAKISIVPEMVSLSNAENRLNQAQIAFTNAQREYNRNKGLFDEGIIAESDYRRFELDYKSAQEELAAAEDNVLLIRSGTSKRAGGKGGNTIVKATIGGMILDVPIEEGNSVIEANNFNDGTTIASIADMKDLIFKGKIDESEVGKIKVGMDLLLTVGALENEQYNAKLEYISPKGVEENGAIQFEMKAAIVLSSDQFLRANYSANADIVLNKRDSVMAIEESLLKFEDDKKYVEVEVADQEFKKRYVEVGLSDGIYIEVLEGLKAEDKIKSGVKEVVEGEGNG